MLIAYGRTDAGTVLLRTDKNQTLAPYCQGQEQDAGTVLLRTDKNQTLAPYYQGQEQDASTVLLQTDNNSADMPAVITTYGPPNETMPTPKFFFPSLCLYDPTNPTDPREPPRGGFN